MVDPVEHDLLELFRVIKGLGKHSFENDPDLDKQLKNWKDLEKQFCLKYKQIEIKTAKKIEGVQFHIYLKTESLKTFFDEAASKIKGLSAVGTGGFDEVSVKDASAFAEKISQISDELFLTYTQDTGTYNVYLRFDIKQNMVEMIYDSVDSLNPMTPEFSLIKMYAQKDFDPKIDLKQLAYSMGFFDIGDEAAFEWEDKFYPKMTD